MNKDNLDGTQEQFGYEWERYNEIVPKYKIQFQKWIYPFELKNFIGKSFIDAGCGIGRNSFWPLEAGAESCLAFDFDHRTIKVAKNNLQQFKNVDIKYLSIYDLDINSKYEIAFSIGVIHHLKHPAKAVEKLYKSLKKDGKLIIWVYAKEGNEMKLIFLRPIRYFTTKLPLGLTKLISKLITYAVWLFLRIYSRSPYLKLMKTFSFRHTESIIFDQLIPKIANYWTKNEVLDLLDGLKVRNIEIYHTNEMSWTLICEKDI
jgi:2-polyprenyl-3-methyl-5-hydroxy-6-metoxy-1,4-benzoquinol methylase